jgi:phosphatidylglycerol:prolipoprotein diacylglycerol transferase
MKFLSAIPDPLAGIFPIFAYWVDRLSPFLVRFGDNFGIRYYGLAYLLGFLGASWLLHRYHRAGRSPLGPEQIGDLMLYIVAGVLLGGRLGYFLLYDFRILTEHPQAVLRVWEGGMASHGGFIGVCLAVLWFARKHRVSFFQISDLIVSTVPVGLMFGRIANFINGELWGKSTRVPWAVIFPLSAPPGTPLALIVPRHPSQLYEAALEGAVLLAWMQWRFWRSDVVRTRPGRLSGEFLIGYAAVRILGECFREPDAPLMFGLSRGTFYSLFLAIAGVVLVMRTGPAMDREG